MSIGHSLRTGNFLFCVMCLGRLDKESRRADSNRFPHLITSLLEFLLARPGISGNRACLGGFRRAGASRVSVAYRPGCSTVAVIPAVEHQRRGGGADIGSHAPLCAPLASRQREPSSASRATGASPSCRSRRSPRDRPDDATGGCRFGSLVETCSRN